MDQLASFRNNQPNVGAAGRLKVNAQRQTSEEAINTSPGGADHRASLAAGQLPGCG
jgi:hypothetical protein